MCKDFIKEEVLVNSQNLKNIKSYDKENRSFNVNF